MQSNPQETPDLVTLTEQILNGKLNILCSREYHLEYHFEFCFVCTHAGLKWETKVNE